jgi:hypothetical protein
MTKEFYVGIILSNKYIFLIMININGFIYKYYEMNSEIIKELEKYSNKNKLGRKFIEKALLKHGIKFDYSKVEYISSDKKIIIICPISIFFSGVINFSKFSCICFIILFCIKLL